MKTPQETAKEMVWYYYSKIGINSNSFIDLSVEFALQYCESIMLISKKTTVKYCYAQIIYELKNTDFKELFKNITP